MVYYGARILDHENHLLYCMFNSFELLFICVFVLCLQIVHGHKPTRFIHEQSSWQQFWLWRPADTLLAHRLKTRNNRVERIKFSRTLVCLALKHWNAPALTGMWPDKSLKSMCVVDPAGWLQKRAMPFRNGPLESSRLQCV